MTAINYVDTHFDIQYLYLDGYFSTAAPFNPIIRTAGRVLWLPAGDRNTHPLR